MKAAAAEPRLRAPGLSEDLGRTWASEWRAWFGPGQRRLARAPDKPDLALVETPLGTVVAKRERAQGWRRAMVALGARPSRPAEAFRHARLLRAAGLATPEPLAVLGAPGDAVLVTRYVQGRGLWEVWSAARAPALVELLAQGLARLHRSGFRHRDLKASNLLLTGADAALELCWTDLDGLRRLERSEPRARARDLARLGMSFESAPARAAGVRAGDWPALVRRALELALERAPDEDETAALLGWTRRWRERWIRRNLARGRAVL